VYILEVCSQSWPTTSGEVSMTPTLQETPERDAFYERTEQQPITKAEGYAAR